MAAARRGLDGLKLRALHKIDHPGAPAEGYSAVVLALPIRVQQARTLKQPSQKTTEALAFSVVKN